MDNNTKQIPEEKKEQDVRENWRTPTLNEWLQWRHYLNLDSQGLL